MKPASFRILLIAVMLLATVRFSFSQQKEVRSYTTQRIQNAAPIIDGLLNDEAWNLVDWSGDFTQQSPNEGEAPSQKTQFKIVYDDKNLYVGVRLFDTEPDKIVKRMSRRDGFEGDWIEINIDSYGDKRTAFSFTASVSGVKGDEYVSNDGNNWDASWDPIWYLKTSVDDKGWIAEYRIPLSQLRFADKAVHTWGIQVNRRFFRNDERDLWQPVSREESGWVRHFGELTGLEGIKSQKQLEIQPYVVAKTETFEEEDGNPFATGSRSKVDVGVDGKIGITSDVTLDFTINPEFGQVEADPSQVNLSAFQLFFREQRPFFIEGNNILDFNAGRSMAGGYFNRDNLFYSRRIGRSPRYSPDTEDDEYSKQPDNTKILGSLKLTGKNKNGFSFGLLESVTRKEMAEIDNHGDRRKEIVEPVTNYVIARAQQDFNEGSTVLGAMFTATNRSISDQNLEFLHNSAYTGGIDLTHQWKDRMYYINAKAVFSRVAGTTEAIHETQTSSERYFQRPDNSYSQLDSTRTSLSGSGSTLSFGKQNGDIIFQTGVTYRSPGLELNDAGFLVRADHINQWAWAQYRILEPFGIFRSLRMNINEYAAWDFSGVHNHQAYNVNAHAQLQNFWNIGGGMNLQTLAISNADLRGGPSMRYPGSIYQWTYLGTDRRKKIRINLNQSTSWGFLGHYSEQNYSTSITYRPINAMEISLRPNFSNSNSQLQYVETVELDNSDEYILARIKQKTYNFSLRLAYNINPNLSIQYWGQPYISRGEYSEFKKVTHSNAKEYTDRFEEIGDNQITYNEEDEIYFVDENLDGTTDFEFDNPSFDFTQFRSNMVLRWEYKPGSTLFVVWTQSRTNSFSPEPESSNTLSNQYSTLFRETPHNIFLVKLAHRFVR